MIAPGTRLGPYEISSKLGEGGMGEVYRATDAKLKREVAIKVLPAAFTQDRERLARFEREAQVLAQLHHPNIASIFGLEESGGVRGLVMELVEGEDLSARLERGALPLDEALPVARQIAEALEAAHEQGIVHRDLKPQNVKLRPDGGVKVLDFGLAKALDPLASSSPSASPTFLRGQAALANSPTLTGAGTQLGVILGTAAYMAPEQAKGRPVDKRADVWAFGVLLWEMLAGRRLFAGETVPETLAGVLREEIDFAALPAATPPRVRALLRRCLERDPRLRLRDIGEARIALDPAAPAAVEAAGGASPAAASSALRRWLAVGVAGALVLLGVLAGRASRRAPVPAATVRATLEAPAGWGVHLLNRSLAFSPDGRQLALALSKGGIPAAETQLALRALDRLEATPVAGTGDASYPFWSPDGKAIGFFADGKLKRLDVESGSIRTLCDAPSGRGAAWSPRGTIVLAPVAAGALAEVLAAGGAPRRIACADGAECHQRLPQYLPDGRRVLFYWDRGAAGPEDPATPSGAYVWDPERPEPRLVLAGDSEALYVHPGFLAFVREGNLLVQPFDLERLEASGEPRTVAVNVAFNPSRFTGPYAFSPLGDLAYQTAATEVPRQLAWFDGEGRMSAPIGSPAGYRWLNPSPDGRRALALIGAAVVPHSVWLVDLERGLRTALLPDLTMDVGAWSADGKMIAVALTWAEKIVFQGVDGAMAPREFKAPADSEVLAPLFLPDGSGILFSQRSSRGDKQSDVMLLRFAAGAEPSPLLTGPAIETALSFSPDGRWLLFRSVAPPRRELYVAAFPDVTRRWLLATGTTLSPAWRSNGEVLYADEQGRFFTVALRQRADALEIGAPQPAFGSLRLADRVAPAAYVRARDRLLVATAVGEAEPAPLVLLTGWQGALGR